MKKQERWKKVICGMLAGTGIVCVLLVLVATFMVGSGRAVFMPCYDMAYASGVLEWAERGYLAQMNQCRLVQHLVRDAQNGATLEFAVAYADYMDDMQNQEHVLWRMTQDAVSYGQQMNEQQRVFQWSGQSYDWDLYEELVVRAYERLALYKIYCEHLAEIVLDETKFETQGEACLSCLDAVVQADAQLTTGLYQLVSREMMSQQQMQRDGYPDESVLESMTAKQQEELLYLSEGDLKERYLERFQEFCLAEYAFEQML